MKPEGFRGKAYQGMVSPECYYRLPYCLKAIWHLDSLIIAHDPRPSSKPLYEALKAGAQDTGLKVYDCGILPTPVIAKWQADFGGIALVVTASHNPVTDNGLKIIGQRLTVEQSQQLTTLLLSNQILEKSTGNCVYFQKTIKDYYVKCLKQQGLKVDAYCRVDHAHGSWAMHLDILEALGLKVNVVEAFKSERINQSGCLHVDYIAKEDPEEGLIVCFDGDGDRLNLVSRGKVLDGDDILYNLVDDTRVVGTSMTNQGLVEALVQQGIACIRVDVGDFHVASALKKHGLRFGAEPCGHIIDLHWMTLSDPVYILLMLLRDRSLKPVYKYPQRHIALPLDQDIDLIQEWVSHPRVRHVVRKSETEPVIRVMLEGPRELIDELALQITDQALNS